MYLYHGIIIILSVVVKGMIHEIGSTGTRFPHFFIIGAAKCGTTSLHALLSSHKEVCDIGTKELHFFDKRHEYSKGYDLYRQYFNTTHCNSRYFIDSTPDYLRRFDVPIRFASTYDAIDLQRKKFIVVLRDPVYALYSWYNHQMGKCVAAMSKHIQTMNNFLPEVGWNTTALCASDHCQPLHCTTLAKFAVPSQEVKSLATFAQYHQNKDLRNRGQTIDQLKNWLKYVHRSQIFIVNLADLLAATGAVMRRMTDFLGLKEPFPDSVVFPHENEVKVKTEFDCLTRMELYKDLDPYTKQLMDFIRDNRTDRALVDQRPPTEPYFSPFSEYRC